MKAGTRTPVRLTDEQRKVILAAAGVEGITNLSDATAAFAARAAAAVVADAGPLDAVMTAEVEDGELRAQRPEPVLDPLQVLHDSGVEELRRQLDGLEVEQLHAIIRRYGMDHDRRALRWRTTARLVERIVEHATTRAAKGSALR